jgi:hypothetical protein
MKDLQQSFKTSEMLETYICNIGKGKRLCRSIPAVGVGAGGESRCVSTICFQHKQRARSASGLDRPGSDARDGRTSTTGTGACDERGREARDGTRVSGSGWGARQQRGECASASRTGQPQGAATGEEEANEIRIGDFF